MSVSQRDRVLSPEHIYYDIQIFNKKSPTTGPGLPISFNETKNSPIVKYSSDYYLSIIRFQCDTTCLPSYEVLPWTPFSLLQAITIEKVNRFTNQYIDAHIVRLMWTPENVNSKIGDDDYYWGSSIPYLVSKINDGIKSCFETLDGVDRDYFIVKYNSDTNRLEVYGLLNHTVEGNSVQGIDNVKYNLYFNRELQSMFSGMNYERSIKDEDYLQRYYRLRFDYRFDTVKLNGNKDYISNIQMYDSSSSMSPVSSICFTTNTLPVIKNELAAPIVYYDGKLEPTNVGSNNYINLITDISANESFYKPNILYNPTAEYRLIDLNMSQRPINNIDFSCFWKHKDGRFFQMYLYSGGAASIKFMFKKKETEFIEATKNLI